MQMQEGDKVKGFKVTALSKKGEKILQQQIDEQRKQPIHARLMFGRLFRQETTEKPLSLNITLKNAGLGSVLDPDDFVKKIRESFSEHKCEESRDYLVEVF